MGPMIVGSGRCHRHPDRPGLGVCVECRQVICRECTTQFEGINRCARCLDLRLARGRRLSVRREWTAANLLWAGVAAGVVFGFVWAAASLAQG
jgi:hypothetical protein